MYFLVNSVGGLNYINEDGENRWGKVILLFNVESKRVVENYLKSFINYWRSKTNDWYRLGVFLYSNDNYVNAIFYKRKHYTRKDIRVLFSIKEISNSRYNNLKRLSYSHWYKPNVRRVWKLL